MSTETVPIQDDTLIFQQLESYPWEQDGEYQIGLKAILGQATEASQIQELTHRAQVFYLARKKNTPIDFDAYKAYLSSKSSKGSALEVNTNSNSNSDSTLNSTSLPNSNFNSTTATTSTPEGSAPPLHPVRLPSGSLSTLETSSFSDSTLEPLSKPSEAPYPPTFAEIVALITSGAPIPGIVEIPPIVIPEQASKPVAKKRRKPWEKDVPEEVVQALAEGTFGDRRDELIIQDLPDA